MDISAKPIQKDHLRRAHLHAAASSSADEDEDDGPNMIREPAEEFPILYRLLTAPKSVKPRNKDELFHMSISKREADSSSFWERSDFEDDCQVEDDNLPSSTTNDGRSNLNRTGYYSHLLRRRLLMKRRSRPINSCSGVNATPPMTKLRSILTRSEDHYYHSRRNSHQHYAVPRRGVTSPHNSPDVVSSNQMDSSLPSAILEQLVAPLAPVGEQHRNSSNKCTLCDLDLTLKTKKDTILSRLLSSDGKLNSQTEEGSNICRCPKNNINNSSNNNINNGMDKKESSSIVMSTSENSSSSKYEEIIKILRRQPIISSNENPDISYLLTSPHLGAGTTPTKSSNKRPRIGSGEEEKADEDGNIVETPEDRLVLFSPEDCEEEQNENEEIIIPVDYSKRAQGSSGGRNKRKRATEITVMNYKGKKLYPCSGFDCEQMFSSLDHLVHHLESHEETPTVDRIEKIQIHFN